jgi:penicillin-binding protein 1A
MTKIKLKKLPLTKSRINIARANLSKNRQRIPKIRTEKIWIKKFKKVMLILLAVVFLTGISGVALFFNYLQSLTEKLPNPETIFPVIPEASEIFDRRALLEDESGTRLYRIIGAQNSDNFKISDIPEHVKLAFLAAEDKEFYIHNGFNLAAIIRCGFRNLTSSEQSCGGSTITQQLVKLTTKRNAPTIERKIEELMISLKLEQTYTKDEILGMYLRIAPFGSSIVGLKTASNFYFGVEPAELNLAQATILAAIIQNPNYLSPTLPVDQDIERARNDVADRQEYIFGQLRSNLKKFNEEVRMKQNDPEMDDILSEEDISESEKFDWISTLKPPVATDIKAGHFVNFVLNQLQTRNYKNGVEPFTREELQSEGYQIYTTLDYEIQKIAETKVFSGGTSFPQWNVRNAALMTAIPETGQILAWAGSKSFTGVDEGCDAKGQNCAYNPQVDVLQSLQEPGSSNKPLGYYLAYKEGLLYPGSILPDIPIKIRDVNGNFYEPKNWNNTFSGVYYSAKSALVQSRNIPAIQVIQMVGVNNYINTFKEFGYTTATGQYGEAAILGGISVYPWEHAQAYTVFANGGDLAYLDPILLIKDKFGQIIYEAKPQKKKVADERAVFLLNDTIRNYDGYSDRGRDMAGKTGTTDNSMDAWYIGYSPDFVTVCWAGNNNNSPMDLNRGFPFYVVHPWCKEYFNEIGGSPYMSAKTPFRRPGGISSGGNSCNANGECIGIEPGYIIEDKKPRIDRKIVKIQVCSDQTDKKARPVDIAMGKAVEQEYNYFIMPIAGLQSQLDEYLLGKSKEKPEEFKPNGGPSEECDIQRNDSGSPGPFFKLNNPANSATVSNNLNISGGVYVEDSTLTSVVVTLNNQIIPGCSINNFSNFDITCTINTVALENGTYILKITATDEKARVNTASREIIYNSVTSNNLSFTSIPPTNLTIGTNIGTGCSNPPCSYNIQVNYSGPYTFTTVELFQKLNGITTKIGNMNISGNTFSYSNWGSNINSLIQAPQDTYSFSIKATTSNNIVIRSSDSSSILVN